MKTRRGPQLLTRPIQRRNPFRVTAIPPLAQVYAWPMNRWPDSRGRQILFGAPFLLLFSIWRQLPPVGVTGTGVLKTQDGERTFQYDARNSQFQALYRNDFQAGYEPEVAALIDVLLPDDGVFFDIGSNFGYFSLLAATRPGFRGRIHAFEPFASSYRDLKSMVHQAGLDARIQTHDIALSDSAGTARMTLPDHVHSGLATMEPAGDSAPGSVRMAPLDSLDLPAPQLMKVDAEGAESAILKGAAQTIAKARPHLLFESLRNLSRPVETLAPMHFLADAGYTFYQPAWLRKLDNRPLLVPSDGNHGALSEETLALVPLDPEDRLLGQDQTNILAVHESRTDELPQFFSRDEPEAP